MTKLTDSHGRSFNYLRVSLTDRCNFRCLYCMPPEGISLHPRKDILRIEEIEKLIRIFVSLGVDRVRLTGGEPLLRKKIVSLVAALSHIEGLSEVNLTTNGALLAPLAASFKEAGLSGINVSLDSLNRARFKKITLRDELNEVLYGITKAAQAGLKLKINVVALSDMTQKEFLSFCQRAFDNPIEIRFIEFMPLCGTGYKPELVLPIGTLKKWAKTAYDLIPIERGSQVAESFDIAGGQGRLGFIGSMSEPFCDTCNRLRLTATGMIRPCLFSPLQFDLRTALRRGDTDEQIADIIRKAVYQKPMGHEEVMQFTCQEDLPKIRSLGG